MRIQTVHLKNFHNYESGSWSFLLFFIWMRYIGNQDIFLVYWLSFVSTWKHKGLFWSRVFSWTRLRALSSDIWERALLVILPQLVGVCWIKHISGCLMIEILGMVVRIALGVHCIDDRRKLFWGSCRGYRNLEVMILSLLLYLTLRNVFRKASDDISSTSMPTDEYWLWSGTLPMDGSGKALISALLSFIFSLCLCEVAFDGSVIFDPPCLVLFVLLRCAPMVVEIRMLPTVEEPVSSLTIPQKYVSCNWAPLFSSIVFESIPRCCRTGWPMRRSISASFALPIRKDTLRRSKGPTYRWKRIQGTVNSRENVNVCAFEASVKATCKVSGLPSSVFQCRSEPQTLQGEGTLLTHQHHRHISQDGSVASLSLSVIAIVDLERICDSCPAVFGGGCGVRSW